MHVRIMLFSDLKFNVTETIVWDDGDTSMFVWCGKYKALESGYDLTIEKESDTKDIHGRISYKEKEENIGKKIKIGKD